MTLEDKINKFLKSRGSSTIDTWVWNGNPDSDWEPFINNRSDRNTHRTQQHVDREIMRASEVECATSPSQCIRECKKWLLAHPEW